MPIIFIAGILLRPTYATVTPETDQLLSRSTAPTTMAAPLKSNTSDQNSIAAFLNQ
jgi:hypothetical protein